jgi:hypothetical protein
MFDDLSKKTLMKQQKNVEQKSHENLTDVWWVGVRPHDEIFIRFCSTLFHNVSWMFGILPHAPSSWNVVEQNLTNVWHCSKRIHTMRLSWDFGWRCSQMFHVVSQMFDVVSQKSHGRNLTKISSCGWAFTVEGSNPTQPLVFFCYTTLAYCRGGLIIEYICLALLNMMLPPKKEILKTKLATISRLRQELSDLARRVTAWKGLRSMNKLNSIFVKRIIISKTFYRQSQHFFKPLNFISKFH